MKPEQRYLRNNLKQVRTRLGLSQQDLAGMVGVTRQTIGGVEAGQYSPSATVALRLAGALGCRVEDLFWIEDDVPEVEAVPAEPMLAGERLRVTLARVGGRWVAHPLVGDRAFRTELIPADGLATWDKGADRVRIRPLDDPRSFAQTAVLAGCSPALSLWARAAERWHPGLRVHWAFANSTAALESLGRRQIHAAGVHLFDPATGEHNVPFVRKALPQQPAILVNLGVWDEGLLVRSGNPLGLRTAADLAQPGVTLVNREPGAGSRQLLERALRRERVPFRAVPGFDRVVRSHLELAREVAAGRADAGVSAAVFAAAFGLGFVSLHQVRYDVVVLKEDLEDQVVRQLLDLLSHRQVRAQLASLGGYDIGLTGEVVATVESADTPRPKSSGQAP